MPQQISPYDTKEQSEFHLMLSTHSFKYMHTEGQNSMSLMLP